MLHKIQHHVKHHAQKLNKDTLLIAAAVLAVAITAFLLVANNRPGGLSSVFSFSLPGSNRAVAEKAINYLNTSVLQGQTATLGTVSEESGVIKMQVNVGGKTYDSYVTKDGKLFFPESFNLTGSESTAQNNPVPQDPSGPTITAKANVQKTSKPAMAAFVVADCPYGLQMQRAMADAVAKVPALANYVTVRYIGSIAGGKITAMHGESEAQENLRQICLREEQQAKYWSYVSCYMKKTIGSDLGSQMPYGDTAGCQVATGVDAVKLDSCVKDPKRGLAYAKEDFDLNTQYNILGSPTVMINNAVVSDSEYGGRSSNAIKNMVCESATTPPGFCSTQLATTDAATSFSTTY